MREIKTAWIITGMPVSPGVGAGGFLEVNVGKDCGDKVSDDTAISHLTDS